MKKSRYMTAKEATAMLGVSAATLYAYVSRGLIRSETIDGSSRTHRYNAEDVQKLKARKTQRKNPAEAARLALYWGAPILESALTLIDDGKLYYRGYDATELATNRSFEEVAALLWLGEIRDADQLFSVNTSRLPQLDSDLPTIQKLHIALALATADDLTAYDLSPAQVARTGVRLLHLMTAVIANSDFANGSIAERLSEGWQHSDPRVASLLNAALILQADHELNASSFAARVAAATDATPYSVAMAGMAVLQGRKHGGNTALVEALFNEVGEPDQAYNVIAARLRRGERIPGFGHKLYSDGDPRAKCLLTLIEHAYPDASALQMAREIAGKVGEIIDIAPNIDFAAVTLTRTLNLPDGTALALFALGRTVGWIAHALEQYAQGELIRPRANYVGVPPRKL